MRIGPQIYNQAGTANPLLVCAPALESFFAVEIGTIMLVTLFAVKVTRLSSVIRRNGLQCQQA